MTTLKELELQLNIDLHSFWHIGSGRGRDAVIDAEVARNAQGLPYIPGKTLKGLLRKAMTLLFEAKGQPVDTVHELFGTPVRASLTTDSNDLGDENASELERGRFNTKPGALWIGSAELPKTWQDWVKSNPSGATPVVNTLFRTVASTAIDERGLAREHTLRVSEVVVPMSLVATIAGPATLANGASWVELLREALPLVRALGVRRRRGYGRVSLSLSDTRRPA
jgi:CRISPR/Cas system CSM-associated protein Csm3 (group 7 of RAMP superfamily)